MASEGFPKKRKRYHFLLSSFTAQEKELLAGMIQKLGGTYLDSPYFVRSCTHVVCGKPSRGEKFLSGCASGKWILRKEFILDSSKAGHWLNEETYEWNEKCSIDGVAVSHLSAPCRWRTGCQQKGGPFGGWKALVAVTDTKRRTAYKRLLEAGGAILVSGKMPYSASLAAKLTHIFVEKALENDVEPLKDARVPCLTPDYIPEVILQDPIPSPEAFMIAVYRKPITEPCVKVNRVYKGAKNTPVLGNTPEGMNRRKSRVQHESDPSSLKKLKQNCPPLSTSPKKKRKQVTTCSTEFPPNIVDMIDSYSEECHYSTVLDVIASFLSRKRFPPPFIIQNLVQSISPGPHSSFKTKAFLLLQEIVLVHSPFHHPSLYESAFCLATADSNEASCAWEFVKSIFSCSDESNVLPLRFFTMVIERDFHDRLSQSISSANEKLDCLKDSLLWKLFWSGLSLISFNVRIRELFKLTWSAACCACDSPIKIPTLHTLSSLVSMTAQCYVLSDAVALKCTESSVGLRLSERSRTFVMELSVVCGGSLETETALRMFLETCSCAWLKMHVIDLLLANYVHRLIPKECHHLKAKTLSLEKIVSCYFFLLPLVNNVNTAKNRPPLEPVTNVKPRRDAPLQLIGQENHPKGFDNVLTEKKVEVNKAKKKGVNRRNVKGETPLHVACIKNDVSKVKLLLADGADANITDYAGWTPLHEACNHGNVACVRGILEARTLVFGSQPGATLDTVINVLAAPCCGTTPLHDAASNNHHDAVELLVRSGGLPLLEAKNKQGETPFDVAAVPEMKDFLRALEHEIGDKGDRGIMLPSEDTYQAALGRKGRRAVHYIPTKDCEQYLLLLSHLVQSYARTQTDCQSEHFLWKNFATYVDNLECHLTRIAADQHLSPLIRIRLSAMRLMAK